MALHNAGDTQIVIEISLGIFADPLREHPKVHQRGTDHDADQRENAADETS